MLDHFPQPFVIILFIYIYFILCSYNVYIITFLFVNKVNQIKHQTVSFFILLNHTWKYMYNYTK